MTHWDMYNTFERLIFLVGYLVLAVIAFIVLLTIVAIVALAIDKVHRSIKEHKAKEKAQKVLGSSERHINFKG
jgi:large-conductance mechanosensitive channel